MGTCKTPATDRARRRRGAVACAAAAAVLSAACPAAPKRDPGLVDLSTAVDRPVIPAGKTGEVVLKVTVGARQPPRASRPPLNLGIVVDTSGSMEGKPIEDAREAVADLLGRLREGDRAALIGFGSVATVLGRGAWESSSPPEEMVEAVGKIRAEGTTDMRAGLVAAFAETAPARDGSRLSRIILLSDGRPNDPTGLLDMARAAASEAMPIVAFGLGIEFDEALLADMARTSGGHYAFLSGSEQIAERFQGEVLKLETLVARNVSVEVIPGPNIDALEVVGWDDLSPDRSIVVALGDLVGGRTREVIVRLAHGERSHDARVELADVRLRYLDTYGESGFQEKIFYVGARASEDPALVEQAADAAVTDALAAIRANLVAMRAAEAMRRGDLDGAAWTLTVGIETYRRTYAGLAEPDLDRRREFARMRALEQAAVRVDPEGAALAQADALRALDEAGVGALTVPTREAHAQVTEPGSAGRRIRTEAAPAAAPAPPRDWAPEEERSILEVHSQAYESAYGD